MKRAWNKWIMKGSEKMADMLTVDTRVFIEMAFLKGR